MADEDAAATAVRSIIELSSDKPTWQRGVLRRLCHSHWLTSADCADLRPICKEAHGRYRMKETIPTLRHAMAEIVRTGEPYQACLDPPPGPPTNPDGSFAPLPEWKPGAPKPKNWPPHIHPPRGVQP